jgi:hypothetical protein
MPINLSLFGFLRDNNADSTIFRRAQGKGMTTKRNDLISGYSCKMNR